MRRQYRYKFRPDKAFFGVLGVLILGRALRLSRWQTFWVWVALTVYNTEAEY